MKLSSDKLRQIITEEVTNFSVSTRSMVSEEDVDVIKAKGDPNRIHKAKGVKGFIVQALEKVDGLCLDNQEERGIVADHVAKSLSAMGLAEGMDSSDEAAMEIDQALDQIENIHKELWGFEAIPREMMESLDAQMQIINSNWTAMTGLEEADEGGPGVHDIMNMPEPEMPEPTGNPKEDALRNIVAGHQAGKVDGQKVDAFSASAIVQVLDALSPENKAKFLDMPVMKMAEIAFKLLK